MNCICFAQRMRHLASTTLLLSIGIAAAYAQQTSPKMNLSGTGAPSTVNLHTGTGTSEYNLMGAGPGGHFTLRVVSAGAASPEASSTCSGLYIPIVAGEGVLRSSDGSLLKLNLTGGSDCIDLVAGQALCIRIFQTIGGTGRFRDVSGTAVTLTMTVAPVVPNQFGSLFTVTGELSGVTGEEAHENQQE